MSKKIFLLLLIPATACSMTTDSKSPRLSRYSTSQPIVIKKQNQEKIKALEERNLLIKNRWLDHPLRREISWDKQLSTGWPHDPLKHVTTSGQAHYYYFHPKNQEPDLIAHFDPREETVTTYVPTVSHWRKITVSLVVSYEEFLHIFRNKKVANMRC